MSCWFNCARRGLSSIVPDRKVILSDFQINRALTVFHKSCSAPPLRYYCQPNSIAFRLGRKYIPDVPKVHRRDAVYLSNQIAPLQVRKLSGAVLFDLVDKHPFLASEIRPAGRACRGEGQAGFLTNHLFEWHQHQIDGPALFALLDQQGGLMAGSFTKHPIEIEKASRSPAIDLQNAITRFETCLIRRSAHRHFADRHWIRTRLHNCPKPKHAGRFRAEKARHGFRHLFNGNGEADALAFTVNGYI